MMKVYLAVPIVAHREVDKAKIIANLIRSLGHEIISTWVLGEDPGFSMPTTSVFERDLNGVKRCDILVAEVSKGSHGVGMEVMAAYFFGKPIILLFEEGSRVSHMLLGVPGARLIKYRSQSELITKLVTLLRRIVEDGCAQQ
jgi:nucleoside 2-deoxyribosyltransferase